MLQELRIHNLALAESLELAWPENRPGLTVLTGETGAGKSIIMQALNLLAGVRAAAGWVRDGCSQASIEAAFSLAPGNGAPAAALLAEHCLGEEAGGQCIMRRVLYADGRSRLFVNDIGVTAKLAAELSTHLFNIASQHEQQCLLTVKKHLDLLDRYAGIDDIFNRYAGQYALLREAEEALAALRAQEENRGERSEFLRLQVEEIHQVSPLPGEDEKLARERDRLKSSEKLVDSLDKAGRLLNAITNQLVEIKKYLVQAAGFDAELDKLAARAETAGFELEDIAAEAGKYLTELPTDNSRLEVLEERLASLKQLMRKHGPSLEAVLEYAQKASRELESLENIEEALNKAEKKKARLWQDAKQGAEILSQARMAAAAKLSAQMERELGRLNFLQARFTVNVGQSDKLNAHGQDEVEFLFSANPGEAVRPLARIVSGGELSRLLLAMKCLLARRDAVETVIFDEVDTGLGGQTAEAVAEKLSELGHSHQVICITHSPQIAARADFHFKVEKRVEGGRTTTAITPLDEKTRDNELARMLDGERAGEQTHAYVRELLARSSRERHDD